jgi:hypothetical protein
MLGSSCRITWAARDAHNHQQCSCEEHRLDEYKGRQPAAHHRCRTCHNCRIEARAPPADSYLQVVVHLPFHSWRRPATAEQSVGGFPTMRHQRRSWTHMGSIRYINEHLSQSSSDHERTAACHGFVACQGLVFFRGGLLHQNTARRVSRANHGGASRSIDGKSARDGEKTCR